ncbi:MAG: roadblock/LC7 domain-containing protein [Thermomicrobiaceae bacterium]
MDDQLLGLLEYEGVLCALVTTPDGLIVAAAGIEGDDAEVIGAAGSTLWSTVDAANEPSGSLDVGSASIHLLRGGELSLVVLSDPSVPHESIIPLMAGALDNVSGVFS